MAKKLIPLILSILILLLEQSVLGNEIKNKNHSIQEKILKLNELIEKEIVQEDTHCYFLNLAVNEFFFVNVKQIAVDAAIELISPDGELLTRINTPDLIYGDEALYWVSSKEGQYKISVKQLGNNSKGGKYNLKLCELHQAQDTDYKFVEAQQNFVNAEKLRAQGDKESKFNSIEFYKKAIEAWKNLGQKDRQGISLNFLGEAYYFLGNYREALNYVSQAVEVLPLGSAKALSLSNLAGIYRSVGNIEQSLKYNSEALKIAKEVNDKHLEGLILNVKGITCALLGKYQESIDSFSQALDIARKIGNISDVAASLHNFGYHMNQIGHPHKAVVFLKEALLFWEKIGNLEEKTGTLGELGLAHLQIYVSEKNSYELNEALEFYRDALEVAKKIGNKQQEVTWLCSIAYIFYLKQENLKSLDIMENVLSLIKENGIPITPRVLHTIGLTHLALGNKEKAIAELTKACDLAKKNGNLVSLRTTLYFRALAFLDIGNLEASLEDIEQAIEIFETSRKNIFNEEINIFEFSTFASPTYGLYIQLLMELHKKKPQEGYALKAFNANEKSIARTLIEMIEEAKIDIRKNINKELVEMESQAHRLTDNKKERLLKLREKPGLEQEKSKLEVEVKEFDTQLKVIQSKIRESNPQYTNIVQPKILTVEQIQKDILDEETLLVEYFLGSKNSYVWAITKSSFQTYKLPNRTELEKQCRPIINYCRNRYFPERETSEEKKERLSEEKIFKKSLSNLSYSLLSFLENEPKKKKMLIVTDGILKHIPFAALEMPNAKNYYPLILDYQIVSASSVSTFATLREQPIKMPTASIVVFADPIFNLNDERIIANKKDFYLRQDASPIARTTDQRLFFSATEAQTIAEVYADQSPRVLLGGEASLFNATNGDLEKYRIIHFATHSFFNNISAEESGLVLSRYDLNGAEKDSHLTTSNIFNLKLSADLVVLSACQSQLGKDVRGEGTLGLSRGFIYAGTKRVLFTLWNINDQSTSVLMKNFYTSMKKGLKPSQALRKAQIEMIKSKKFNDIYYWAGFKIEGDW